MMARHSVSRTKDRPHSLGSKPLAHAQSLLRILDAVVSVSICYVVFAAFKPLDRVLDWASRLLYGRVLDRHLKARSVLTLLLASMGLIFIVSPWYWAAGSNEVYVSIFRAGGLIALLALLYRCVPVVVEVPATLGEIQTHAQRRTIDNWVASRMRNPLDSVWIRPLTGLLALSFPAWLALVTPGTVTPWTVAWYAVAVSLASETVATFEHANGHYRFFRPGSQAARADKVAFTALRLLFEHVLDLLLARIPHWYGVEHVLVHHAEDNGPADLQSTERYDRASFIDFARCANRFALSGMLPLDVIWYLSRHRRWKGLKALARGLCLFYGMLTLIGLWNLEAVVLLLALRYANLVQGALTFFQEHGFIDVSEPSNIYRNSLHYINAANSHASLGEDPHIEHHLHPGRHWSEYISAVERDLDRYASESAIGFLDGPGHVRKYYRLMWQRKYRELACMFVVFGRQSAPQEEVAALLEARTRPVNGAEMSTAMRTLDSHLGRMAGLLLP